MKFCRWMFFSTFQICNHSRAAGLRLLSSVSNLSYRAFMAARQSLRNHRQQLSFAHPKVATDWSVSAKVPALVPPNLQTSHPIAANLVSFENCGSLSLPRQLSPRWPRKPRIKEECSLATDCCVPRYKTGMFQWLVSYSCGTVLIWTPVFKKFCGWCPW